MKTDRFEPFNCGNVRILKATDKAFLVESDALGEEIWVPKSQINSTSSCGSITEMSDEGDEGDLVLPMWLAREKNFTD
jgi:hypothetical protein